MTNLPQFYLDRTVFSLAILMVAYFISLFLKKTIDFTFARVKGRMSKHEVIVAKTRTIRYVIKNVITVVFFFIAMLMILAQCGLNLGPIMTGAGIIGLAFSFGSQTLVKDIIAGFFIIIEDQFNIGDKIKVAKDIEGVVSNITLRLTVLKDRDGNLIYVPNSQITTVTRYNSKPKISSIRPR